MFFSSFCSKRQKVQTSLFRAVCNWPWWCARSFDLNFFFFNFMCTWFTIIFLYSETAGIKFYTLHFVYFFWLEIQKKKNILLHFFFQMVHLVRNYLIDDKKILLETIKMKHYTYNNLSGIFRTFSLWGGATTSFCFLSKLNWKYQTEEKKNLKWHLQWFIKIMKSFECFLTNGVCVCVFTKRWRKRKLNSVRW